MRLQAIDAGITNLFAYARGNKLATLGWIVSLYFSFLLLGFDWSSALRRGDLGVAPSTALGRDFANVFTAGRLVLEGQLASAYDLRSYQGYQNVLFAGTVSGHNYSYTPISFLYVWMFGLVPYAWSYLLWTGLTGAAFVWAARPYLRDAGLPAWLALLLPASLMNIWAGHYGFLIGALWLGSWHLLESRPRVAGVLIGLMVVKPHLAILMPLLLIRRGAWQAFAAAAATVVGAVLLSLLLFGTQPWIDYLTKTVGLQASMVDDVEQFFVMMMPTVAPSLFRAGFPGELVWPIQIAIGGAAIAGLWWRLPDDPRQAGLAAACATFLVLPYAFNYDMTAVSVAALCLMRRTYAGTGWPLNPLIVMLAFLLPVITLVLNRYGLPLAPLLVGYMLAALIAPASAERNSALRQPA
jgi:hypothetical protein